MVKATSLVLFIALLSVIASCAEEKKPSQITKSDCPAEVKIGTRYWMTKNLDVTVFRNGESIPEVLTVEKWAEYADAKKPAWCYYGNDPVNGGKYGKLYNWYAVIDSRGLAPSGWHISKYADWSDLEIALAGKDNAAQKIKSTSGWYSEYDGSNSTCFSAFPGGYRYAGFTNIENSTGWWISDTSSINYVYAKLVGWGNEISNGVFDKESAFYIRCVKD